jgi:hypothetical protein
VPHPLDPHGPAFLGGPGRAAVHPRRDVRLPLVVGLAALGATVYLGLSDPYRPGAHLVCPVLALTGFVCAGCGGQRAVHELARLDVVAAWAMNPLVVVAVPVVAAAWWRWLRRRWRGVPPGAAASSTVVPWLVAGVVVAFAVLRNVPALAPWLAP